MDDWLTEFVEYGKFGEASPRILYWVGVSTIAAALRRKVWFDQAMYQWSPNFYILIVGEPGAVKKSTSIDIGLNLLKEIPGINFGPSSVTWQALIQYIAESNEDFVLPGGEVFEMSCVTLALSEFGTFFKPDDDDLVSNLTDLWDGKLGVVEKMTKTSGNDRMVNPWINLISATTPKWMAKNFSENLVGGGLAGRCIFLHGEMPPVEKDVAYPKRGMPVDGSRKRQKIWLVDRLTEMSALGGEADLTEDAYIWGDEWYKKERAILRAIEGESVERGFMIRKQTHLHKLAMVIAAARGELPVISLASMQEADRQLALLNEDAQKIFGYVGQNRVSTAARQIVEAVDKLGTVERRMLYRKQFFRTMAFGEFMDAVTSAVQAELILEADNVANPMLISRSRMQL